MSIIMWRFFNDYILPLSYHIRKYSGVYSTFAVPVVMGIFVYEYSFRRKKPVKDIKNVTEVLFFANSDAKNSNYDHFEDTCGCKDCNLKKLKKLMDYIDAAKVSLDICVFTITSHELGSLILKKYKEGVRVRVITDLTMWMGTGSQIASFRQAGILVRTQTSEHFLMHHKFAVVDNELLINGSFNWTAQAIFSNWENITITSVPKSLVRSYSEHFNALWAQLLH